MRPSLPLRRFHPKVEALRTLPGSDTFRLRHVGTGSLLAVALPEESYASGALPEVSTPSRRRRARKTSRDVAPRTAKVLLTEVDSEDTLFQIVPQYPAEGMISVESFFRIKHVRTGFFLHVEMDEDDDDDDEVCELLALTPTHDFDR